MDDLRTLLRQILDQGYLLSLASVDESGPWVSDVIYTFDGDLNLYWISQSESRHSKAFVTNPLASGAITVVEKPEGKGIGLQISGTVRMLAQIPANSLALYTKKRKGETQWIPSAGEVWYRLTPSKFDLIYEPLFGFTKKFLILT